MVSLTTEICILQKWLYNSLMVVMSTVKKSSWTGQLWLLVKKTHQVCSFFDLRRQFFCGVQWTQSVRLVSVSTAHRNNVLTFFVSAHYHLFVGDLSPDVTDSLLWDAFKGFESLSEARVMMDPAHNRSRGYGFVAFRDRAVCNVWFEEKENGLFYAQRDSIARDFWSNTRVWGRENACP